MSILMKQKSILTYGVLLFLLPPTSEFTFLLYIYMQRDAKIKFRDKLSKVDEGGKKRVTHSNVIFYQNIK